jgi:hypothetical protein
MSQSNVVPVTLNFCNLICYFHKSLTKIINMGKRDDQPKLLCIKKKEIKDCISSRDNSPITGFGRNFLYFKIKLYYLFARLYSIWLFTTSVSKMVSSVYSLLTINSMVSNFWCSRTVSKVYSKLIDYYNNFYVDGS